MANLNKLFIHVPTNVCRDFRLTYVTGGGEGVERKKDYDEKICFLEDTKEIFTKGKIYGCVEDLNALKALVGKLPENSGYNNIIDYLSNLIGKKIDEADHVHSVSKSENENLIFINTNTETKTVTISSSSDLKNAVNKANSAVQSLSILGKTLDKNTTSIDAEEAKKFLKLGSAAYKKVEDFDTKGAADSVKGSNTDAYTAYTVYGTRAYASYLASNVESKFPGVIEGSGITVTPNILNGKTTYTISTSTSVWHYQGNELTKQDLPSSGNVTGDVYSVGEPGKSGSTLYAWDGDEWINIGGPNGVTDVDTASSSGVALAKHPDGRVKVVVTPGEIESNNNSVVTGGKVYSYIQSNCDAKGTAQNLINALGNSITSENGTYINVTVATSKGDVSVVTVSEKPELKTAIGKANSAMQNATILGYLISNGGSVTVDQAKTTLGISNLGSAAYQNVSYFDARYDAKGAAAKAKNDVIGTENDTYENLTIYGAKHYADTVGERVEAEIPWVNHAASSHGVRLDFDAETKEVKVVVYPNIGEDSVTTEGSVNSKILNLKTNLETQIRDATTLANKAVRSITGDTPYLNVSYTGTSYALDLDETEVFNYVTNNIWDTFSV